MWVHISYMFSDGPHKIQCPRMNNSFLRVCYFKRVRLLSEQHLRSLDWLNYLANIVKDCNRNLRIKLNKYAKIERKKHVLRYWKKFGWLCVCVWGGGCARACALLCYYSFLFFVYWTYHLRIRAEACTEFHCLSSELQLPETVPTPMITYYHTLDIYDSTLSYSTNIY